MTSERINTLGATLRFITPILITIALFILSDMSRKIDKLERYFTNHLEHHRVMEVSFAEKLSRVETTLTNYFGKGR